jgi:glycine dehydrogenase subunit 2
MEQIRKKYFNKTIFEKSISGRRAWKLDELDVPTQDVNINKSIIRDEPIGLPEVSELQVIRHFTRLSQKNFSIDTHFYPLGSCTMKYNSRLNEKIATFDGFTQVHPYQDEEDFQGSLECLYNLERALSEITGLPYVSLQPVAGAQGEFAGISIIREYLKDKGLNHKNEMLIPDSAHGTNPASASMAGYKVKQVKSGPDGCVDIRDLKKVINENTAGIMLTNPNTLGIFEKDIKEIADILHKHNALLYYDGANLNALLGNSRPGDMGFDVVHLNLHKTFSTPHGGGGPGAGPITVSERLKEFLPKPFIEKNGDKFNLNYVLPKSIGKLKTAYGNFLVLMRAYSYILYHGRDGLKRISQMAVLNARYLQKKLTESYKLGYEGDCMHEFVLTIKDLKKANKITAFDIAKRLTDFGVHPPTMYFPLIVPEALMIEPTETEGKESLDLFIETMTKIREEAVEKPDVLHDAPNEGYLRRLDEADATKNPRITCPLSKYNYFEE